jgi:S-adenosylmethionine:tRNA ribosyltransferase-isomerase
MKLSDFKYNLPEKLIAQCWIEPRDHSRLLCLDKSSGSIEDKHFYNILDELDENDVLVLNKTKVINARLHWKIEKWRKTSSSEENKNDLWKTVEIFLHKQIKDWIWDCRVYPWKNLKPWKKVYFKNWLEAEILEITLTWRIIQFNKSWLEFLEIIEKLWDTPLPPYIKKKLSDSSRYQTVWAESEWSVAAPTASLHFTPELIKKLENKWVKIEKVLLHIGLW